MSQSKQNGTICPVTFVKCSGGVCTDNFVQMFCSNAKCKNGPHLIHQKCFEELEDGLIDSLKRDAKDSGLNEAKKRANLWTPRSYFLKPKLGCKCEKGHLWIEKNELDKFKSSLKKPKAKQPKEQLPMNDLVGYQSTKTKRKDQKKSVYNSLSVHHNEDSRLSEPNSKGKINVIKEFPEKQEIVYESRREMPKLSEWIEVQVEHGKMGAL